MLICANLFKKMKIISKKILDKKIENNHNHSVSSMHTCNHLIKNFAQINIKKSTEDLYLENIYVTLNFFLIHDHIDKNDII